MKKRRPPTRGKCISVSAEVFAKLDAYVQTLPKHERYGAKSRLIKQWLDAETKGQA